jgi:Na+-driven multidrug efflux pump
MSIIGFNMVAVVGVLRSGGDTMYCLIMDTVAVYIIGLPLAYLFGLSLEMSVTVVMIAVTSQEIFKFILLYYRYRSKKWINNLVHRL